MAHGPPVLAHLTQTKRCCRTAASLDDSPLELPCHITAPDFGTVAMLWGSWAQHDCLANEESGFGVLPLAGLELRSLQPPHSAYAPPSSVLTAPLSKGLSNKYS